LEDFVNLTGFLTAWILLLPMCSPAAAQRLTLAPQGTLQTKLGKPNHAAPAPQKSDSEPDVFGIWQADPQNAKLSLTVYVQASIGDSGLFPMLMLAEGVASGMFAKAGLRINWRTGQPKAYEAELPILIDVTSNTPATFHRGALAYAHEFEGVHIRVFYDRVENAHRPGATAMLMAHVLVHEITHVLEGTDRHSQQGVMKGQWTSDDLVQMAYKPLPFDPVDVLLIRRGLASRVRASRKAQLGLVPPTPLSN
jgi:hypothetical protein